MALVTHTHSKRGEPTVFRTINKTATSAVAVIGVAAFAVAIYDGKVTNMLIALFIVGAVGVMLHAAVAEISDTMLKSVEDSYDEGKKATEHKADVLELALKRRES